MEPHTDQKFFGRDVLIVGFCNMKITENIFFFFLVKLDLVGKVGHFPKGTKQQIVMLGWKNNQNIHLTNDTTQEAWSFLLVK